MAKKDYFLLIDTETTQDSLVADFAAIVVDRKGNIIKQCAVLVNDIFTDQDNHPLFYTSDNDKLWGKENLPKRYNNYNNMLKGGTRMIASVGAINRWLDKVNNKYNPILTAYNLSFDINKCVKTGIDLAQFNKQFCLWHAAVIRWAHTKKYRKFICDNHLFNAPTMFGNMSYKTDAETMAKFVTSNPRMENEPHTALEDILFYELPILLKLIKNKRKKEFLNPKPFDWKKVQVKDWFTAK